MSKLVSRICRICGKGCKDDEVKEHEKRCSTRDVSTSPGLPSSSKTPSGTLSELSSGTQKRSKEKQKAEGIKTSAPQTSEKNKAKGKRTIDTTPIYSPSEKREKDNLPINAVRRNSPKQAWNARLPEGVPGKLPNPFPGTKSFRYYPIACEFCHKVFTPGALRKHVQKYRPDHHLPSKLRGRGGGKIQPPIPEDAGTSGPRPAGGIPKHIRICYICGGMFGSKSLSIHEPKCLEKWRLENDSLPPNKRRPEPVKLSVSDLESSEQSVSGAGRYASIPEMNSETEAAYQSHLKNLVPCSHCKRTFNPDRIMVHENACVERAKKRVTKIH